MYFVLVGSKESHNPDRQSRDSWSGGELLLISKLPKLIKKGLIAAKCTFKYLIKRHRDGNVIGDGRSHVGSYHMKTTLLNLLEKTPPSNFHSAFQVMMNVFQDFSNYIENGYLPHFFLPECNLLATVGCNEQQIALKIIQDIFCDPTAAILKCPSEPCGIYGDISADVLVAAFHRISTHPSCERSWEHLFQLLSRLDRWRQQCYRGQMELDESLGRSGRPELIALVDMMMAWKKENIWNLYYSFVINHSIPLYVSVVCLFYCFYHRYLFKNRITLCETIGWHELLLCVAIYIDCPDHTSETAVSQFLDTLITMI